MMTVTKVQMDAVRAIGEGRSVERFATRTLAALEAKELARPGSGRWELTEAGKLLLPNVDVGAYVPSVELARPADPFAVFETEKG